MIDQPYLSLAGWVKRTGLALPFVLPEFLDKIDLAPPRTDKVTTETIIDIRVQAEIALKLPGLDSVAFVIGAGSTGYTTIEGRFKTPPFQLKIIVPAVLRIDADVLRPVKAGTNEPDATAKTIDVALPSFEITWVDGRLGFGLGGGLTLPRSMVATSGVIVSGNGIRWLDPDSANKPTNTPAGFTGLFLDDVSVELGGLPINVGTVSMDDVFIGTGGFSGTVSWSDPTLKWANKKFTGIAAGELFGFQGALTKVSLGFRQSALTACEIQADVYVPYLERRIGLDLALDGGGGVTAAAGLPTSAPAETKVSGTGALLHVDVDVFVFDLDEVRFHAGGGGPTSVSLSGRIALKITGIDAPPFAFKGLRIGSDGSVALDGGWLDLSQAKPLKLYGFQLEITKIGFGAEKGRTWVGMSGGIKLTEGLPMGASVEGLRISWDSAAADPFKTIQVSLKGVGLELTVPNAFSFKGSLELFDDDIFGKGFYGHIALGITPIKLGIDARFLVGRTPQGTDYVFIFIAVDLPTGIPIFNTGAAFYGFAGLLAINMRPDRHGDEHWWHGWYKRPPKGIVEPRAKWIPQAGAFALGVGATIGTLPDDGFSVSAKVLFVLSLPGPVLFLQGQGSFVSQRPNSQEADSQGTFEALLVLDVPAKLFTFNLAITFSKAKLIEITGEADAAFSWAPTPPPDVWHVYLGEKEPPEKRIQAKIISLLKADAYFQLRDSGIQLGAGIGFDGDWSFGPAHAWVHARMSMDAAVSWKPAQLDASVSLKGDAGVEAFGGKIQIILSGVVLVKGPKPWYLRLDVHLEIVIDLWFWKFHWAYDLPLEWTEPQLAEPASPIIERLGAEHLKVDETVGVLDGSTIPPDSRPVVIFTRPVHDPGGVGRPQTGVAKPDVVGPRNFTYELGHVVLTRGTGASRSLIGAAGWLTVSGGKVELPAAVDLPAVAGATLALGSGLTYPITGRTATGLGVTGTPPDGAVSYRVRPPTLSQSVQVNQVTAAPHATASLSLAAATALPKDAFAGGNLALGGANWPILESDGATVLVRTKGSLPQPGTGTLTGLVPPDLDGQWLPVDDRTDASDPGPTTKLMLWASSPFALFRHSDQETVDGFNLHNEDYACGPEPTEDPICIEFDDVPRGSLNGAFTAERLAGMASGDVEVIPSNVDPNDHRIAIGTDPNGRPGHGIVTFTFDPPADKVMVTGWTREGGVIRAMRQGAVVAQVPISRKRDVMTLTGEIDSLSIEGTLVLVERLCFTPGWTCIPWDTQSFPGGNGQQTYAGLKLFSFSQMEVDAGTIYVDPITFTLFPWLRSAGALATGTSAAGSGGEEAPTAPAAGEAVLDAVWDRALVPAAATGTSRAGRLAADFGDTRRINRLARGGLVVDRTGDAAPGFGPGFGDIIAQPPGPPIAVLAISLPGPVTRVRFQLTNDARVIVAGGDVTHLDRQAVAGETIAVAAPSGFIDRLSLAASTRVGLGTLCFDAGPFGWQRWEQWTWRRSLQDSITSMYRVDPVLAPGAYTLAVHASAIVGGQDPRTDWEARSASFTVGPPPGLLLAPVGDPDRDKRYPYGGGLADLRAYVETTIPSAGEAAAYRAYDVGVDFDESYVSRMYLQASAGLSVAVLDPNGTDRRADAANAWGDGPEVELSAFEEAWLATLHGDGVDRCAIIDLDKVVRDEGVSAGGGELLAPAALHAAELRSPTGRAPYRFSFTTSRFADFRQHLATFDGRCRVATAASSPTALASAALTIGAANLTLSAAIANLALARTAATTGSPTKDDRAAYVAARTAVRVARQAAAAVSAAVFDDLWPAIASTPPPVLLPEGVELTRVAGSTADLLLLESPEPIRWERCDVVALERSSTTPLRRRSLPLAEAGAPDQNTSFLLDGVTCTTDRELWFRDGAIRPRLSGSWTLTLDVPRAVTARIAVAVEAGGTATMTGAGTAVGAAATAGPTGAATTTLVVTADSLSTVTLKGTGLSVLSIELDEPFVPIVPRGSIRLARAVLPSTSGSTAHSVDLTALREATLGSRVITWQGALDPSIQGTYHTFPAGIALADGRTARVFGGVSTAPSAIGVDAYAGGMTGTLPTTGIVFRLIGPDGLVEHELAVMPDAGFGTPVATTVSSNLDQTRTILLSAAALGSGWWRLRLRFRRDAGAELPVLKVGGNSSPEDAALGFVIPV